MEAMPQDGTPLRRFRSAAGGAEAHNSQPRQVDHHTGMDTLDSTFCTSDHAVNLHMPFISAKYPIRCLCLMS